MSENRPKLAADEVPVIGARILMIETRFHEKIVEELVAGALERLEMAHVKFEPIAVPGALEIPIAAAIALDAASQAGLPYDGIVALGCVIRGETEHFEIVSHQSARGLMDVAIARKVALARRQIAMAFDKTKERTAARLAAVQALYQMDIAATDLPDVLAEFEARFVREGAGEKFPRAESDFFRDIVEGVVREQRILDPMVDEALNANWPLKRVETILRSVMRAGAYELKHRSDIPARVVVSEYVNVASAFLDREETGMVNAVLDHLARHARSAEFSAR